MTLKLNSIANVNVKKLSYKK